MPKAVSKGQKAQQATPEYELTVKLLNEFRELWVKQFAEPHGMDAMLFSRISIVALTQLGAIVAVDVGMNPDQWLAVCNAQFTEAFRNAPRFG